MARKTIAQCEATIDNLQNRIKKLELACQKLGKENKQLISQNSIQLNNINSLTDKIKYIEFAHDKEIAIYEDRFRTISMISEKCFDRVRCEVPTFDEFFGRRRK